MEQKILSYLKLHEAEIREDIETLVQAEGSSAEIPALAEVRRVLTDRIRERTGARVTEVKTGGHNPLTWEQGEGENAILIVGHYDTVHPTGSVPERMEGNQWYGPGIYDMKGGLVSAIWMAKAYRELGIGQDRKLYFVFNGDEEIGSVESRQLICEIAKKTRAAVVCEPCMANGNLKSGRKGGFCLNVDITGRGAHAGNAHELGISAIEEMAREIQFVHSLTDYEKGTTLNVGMIWGGTAANVVAPNAGYSVDCRVCTLSELERVLELVQNYPVSLEGCSRKVTLLSDRPPMEETEANLALCAVAEECGRKLGLEFSHQFVGGGSDGNYVASVGIPVLDGMGVHGDGAHTKDEYVTLDQLIPRMALLASTVLKL